MKPTEVVKRYLLFIASLLFAAFGVAVTKHAELGVSPISSTANVLSCKFTALSLGVWLILWNCVLILGQILILRRQFQPIQLLQLPISLLFGWFTDLGMACVAAIPVPNYPVRLLLVLCGIILLGFGISLSVIANVILNSGEAFVKAISDVSGKNFGDLKIAFDVCCVVLALLLSLLFFQGKIIGAREGTILTALLTGLVVKRFVRLLQSPLERRLSGNAPQISA